MKIISLLLFILIQGCAYQIIDINDNTIGTVDQNFIPYIDKFKQDASISGVNIDKIIYIDIQYKILGGNTVGQCSKKSGNISIYMDLEYWERSNDTDKEMVLYHELGHCLLNKKHNDNVIQVSKEMIPTSIMNPTKFDYRIYKEYRDYYIGELFNGG